MRERDFEPNFWNTDSIFSRTNKCVSDIERFTEGDCWYLAMRLHKLTGWKLMSFIEETGLPTSHGFVQMPNGKYLDIMGIHTLKELRSEYDGTTVSEVSISAMSPGQPWYGPYTYKRARIVANKILDKLREMRYAV